MNYTMETKLPIPRYPSYLITTDGVVYSTKTDRKRQLVPQSDGSLKVGLYSKGMKMEYVHRLVAETFLAEEKEDHHTIVRHKDGNKSNNHVDNLYWSSHAEIRKHGRPKKDYTKKQLENMKGVLEKHGYVVLTKDAAQKIMERIRKS